MGTAKLETRAASGGRGREEAGLIPLNDATVCLWPVSATDGRLHLRIVAGELTPEQRAWLAKRDGRATILDPTGSGDARNFWQLLGRHPGWADAAELRAEFGKLDCDLGKTMRLIQKQVGDAA
jgi:hypothetical protein